MLEPKLISGFESIPLGGSHELWRAPVLCREGRDAGVTHVAATVLETPVGEAEAGRGRAEPPGRSGRGRAGVQPRKGAQPRAAACDRQQQPGRTVREATSDRDAGAAVKAGHQGGCPLRGAGWPGVAHLRSQAGRGRGRRERGLGKGRPVTPTSAGNLVGRTRRAASWIVDGQFSGSWESDGAEERKSREMCSNYLD